MVWRNNIPYQNQIYVETQKNNYYEDTKVMLSWTFIGEYVLTNKNNELNV